MPRDKEEEGKGPDAAGGVGGGGRSLTGKRSNCACWRESGMRQ